MLFHIVVLIIEPFCLVYELLVMLTGDLLGPLLFGFVVLPWVAKWTLIGLTYVGDFLSTAIDTVPYYPDRIWSYLTSLFRNP